MLDKGRPSPSVPSLGLYLVKTQVEAFGGTIDLEGEEGKGLAVLIRFLSITN